MVEAARAAAKQRRPAGAVSVADGATGLLSGVAQDQDDAVRAAGSDGHPQVVLQHEEAAAAAASVPQEGKTAEHAQASLDSASSGGGSATASVASEEEDDDGADR